MSRHWRTPRVSIDRARGIAINLITFGVAFAGLVLLFIAMSVK